MLSNRLTSWSLPLGMGLVLCLMVVAANGQAPAAKDKATTKTLSPSTVLVIVNGEPITQGDVDEFVTMMMQAQMRQVRPGSNIRPEDMQQMRGMFEAGARDKLIDDRLITGAVKPYLEKVTDKDIEARLDEYRKVYAQEGQDFDKFIKTQRIPMSTLKERTKQQIAMTKLVESTEGSITPAEKEVREFIDKNKEKLNRPKSIRTSHILIGYGDKSADPNFKPTEKEKQEAKAKAEQVYKELKAGGDFAKLAVKYSTDPGSKDNGGVIDQPITTDSPFVPEYKDAAFKLAKVGDFSQPVESKFGYHIIKLDEVKAPVTASYENMGDEVKLGLRQQNLMQKTDEMLKKLRAKAKIDVKVPETSPFSGMKNGMNGMSPRNGDGSSTATAPRIRPRTRAPRPSATK